MRTLLIILSVFIWGFSFSQERSLTITTDKESILIGEQIQMTIVLKGGSNDTLVLPNIADTLISEIEVLSRSKVDTSFDGNQLEQRILSQSFTITSFDSGYFPVSPRIAFINGEEIESNPFLVVVQTIQIDTSKGIIDIKEIEQVPFSLKEWFQENWHWLVLGLAAIVLIIFIVRYLKNRKPEEKVEIIIPDKPAHEVALERLLKLKEENLWQSGKTKLYYSELSDIIREYIELRLMIPAMEQTTDEIIQSLRHNPELNQEQINSLKRLLFLSDLVKFAKENPIGSENEANFSLAEKFVHETMQKVESPNKPENV